MADALSELSGQPPIDPEAQSVVTDFLEYTEIFPSDLFRSLSLIGKLDQAYQDDAQRLHQLATTYANLPNLPQLDRPDPSKIRQDISINLDHALRCRESTWAEASRLCQVADNLYNRLVGIKAKLEAMPKPPSREPTPQPPSPTRTRKATDADRTPRLKLFTDGDKHGRRPPGSGRQRKKPVYIVPGDILPPMESFSDISSDSEPDPPPRKSPVKASPIKLAHEKKSLSLKIPKPQKSLTPKPPKTPKIRPPGIMGTNAHSAVAGISVSNAMAALTPPPEQPAMGSEWAPWYELTSYELHQIRRRMKKNANWQPSEVMVEKELERRGRGLNNYRKAKAAAEAKGEIVLDERAHQSSGTTKRALSDIREAEKQTLSAISPSTELQADESGLEKLQNKLDANRKEKQNDRLSKQKAEAESKKDKPSDRAARQKALELELQQKMAEAMRRAQEENDNLQQVLSGLKPAMTPTSAVPSIETPVSATATKKKPSKKRKRESEPSAQTPASLAPKPSTSDAATPADRPSSPKKLKLVPPKPAVEPVLEPESAAVVDETPVSGSEQTSQIPLEPLAPSFIAEDETPIDPMLIDQPPPPPPEEPPHESPPQPSQRASRTPKPRTPTPAPVQEQKSRDSTLAASMRQTRTPSAPPKSPLTEPTVDPGSTVPASAELDEAVPPMTEADLEPEPFPSSSNTTKKETKRSSVSIRLPTKPDSEELDATTAAEVEKPIRQSTRLNSRPVTPKPEAGEPVQAFQASPEHRSMMETAASRRSSRAKPAQLQITPTSTPAPVPGAAPPTTQPKLIIETSASTRPKRSSAGMKESAITASPVLTTATSPTTAKKKKILPARVTKTPTSPSSIKQAPSRSRSKSVSTTTKPPMAPTPTSPTSTRTRRAAPTQPQPQPNEITQPAPTAPRLPTDSGFNRAGEPIYCLCRDVDHGTMIACDNGNCPVEWFHLECVQIEGKPPRRSEWFCPFCRDREDETRMKVGA